MEHQAAPSAVRCFPGKTLAEQAFDLTADRRAIRKLEILSNAQLLQEALVEFGDTDAHDARAPAAFIRRDFSIVADIYEEAAEKMAAHEVKDLSIADLLAEMEEARAERRRDE